MRKDMLKKLPFNLWWCSTTFFGVLFITTFIPQLELLPTILICLFVYPEMQDYGELLEN